MRINKVEVSTRNPHDFQDLYKLNFQDVAEVGHVLDSIEAELRGRKLGGHQVEELKKKCKKISRTLDVCAL